MNHSKRIVLCIAGALAISQSAAAQSVTRIEVSELKSLLVRAIATGAAHGVLVGVAATYVREKFSAPAPIEIDVRVLHPLQEPGCSRLEVITRQRDVLEKASREDKALTYQLNYCRDGRFPEKR